MGRYFTRVLLMIFVLLVNCTILSGFIEKQMTVQAVFVSGKQVQGEQYGCRLPEEAVYENENGAYAYAVETSAFHSELRAKEVSVVIMENMESGLLTNAAVEQKYVRFSSKAVRDGDRLLEVSLSDTRKDSFLVEIPDNINADLPELNSAAKNINGKRYLLVMDEKAARPFMEDRARLTMLGNPAHSEIRIFSVQNICDFFKSLPLLALAIILLLAPFVPLLAVPFQGKNRKRNRLLLASIGAACCLIWTALSLLFGFIEMPSSLLPLDNIFHAGHYHSAFTQIFEGLKLFGNSAAAREVLELANQKLALAGVTLFLGIIILAAVFIVLKRACKRKV